MLRVDWPARLQRLTSGPLVALAPQGADVWLDGGHNVAGGRVLGEAMADLEAQAPRPLVIICGTLATKDTAGFLSAFRGLARRVFAVPIPGEHAGRAPQEVAEAAGRAGLAADCAGSVAEALTLIAAQAWDRPPRILIAGSLYLAGQVLAQNGAPPV